jgi:hypothetical protein
MVALGLALVGCGGGRSAPATLQGKTVVDLPAAMAGADALFGRTAAAAKATVVATSRCYLTESGRAITGGWCGPAAYPGDPIGDYWQALTASAVPAKGGVTVDWALGAHGQPAPLGRRLVRPGERDVEVPAPPVPADAAVLAPGQVAVLDSAGVPLIPPADGRLRAESTGVTVTGVAQTLVAGSDSGGDHFGPDVVEAGPGRELVVASFTVTQGNDPLGVTATDETHISIVADGTSIPINAGSVTGDAPVTVAVSVAKPGGSAVLELDEGPISDGFDLIAGKRTDPGRPCCIGTRRTRSSR